MEIERNGSQPSGKGSSEYFTGTVRIDPLFQPHDPARTLGANVTFEPGARTAWHAHLLGQTLIVTAGCGLAQGWGGPIEQIRPGDVVWFAPGEKHWHGATAQGLFNTAMGGIGSAIGGFAGGLLFERLGAKGMYLVLCIFVALVLVFVSLVRRTLTPEQESVSLARSI